MVVAGSSGFADDIGGEAKNLQLSQDRANAVMQWLIEHGVAADKLEAVAARAQAQTAEAVRQEMQLTLQAASYSAAQQAASGNICNPADTSWSTPLIGADGTAIQDSAPAGTSASPTGTFQFDTQGRLTVYAGTTLTVGTHTITLTPGTGLIQVQ